MPLSFVLVVSPDFSHEEFCFPNAQIVNIQMKNYIFLILQNAVIAHFNSALDLDLSCYR